MNKDFGGVVGKYSERSFKWFLSISKDRINELNMNYWYDLYQDKYIAFYFYKIYVRFKNHLIPDYFPGSLNKTNIQRIDEFKRMLLSNNFIKISDMPGYHEQPSNIQFWIFRGWSEEEANLKVFKIQQNNGLKFGEKIRLTPELYIGRFPTSIEYWLNRGYSEEESKRLLSEHQSTFSLKICIEKYGEAEGTRVFNERQEKWQNTINSKTKEEIDDMNRRKGAGIGNYLNKNLPGKLYYIRFYNHEIEFWKIGITVREVSDRLGLKHLEYTRKLFYEILFVNHYEDIDTAYAQEQYILNTYNQHRMSVYYNGFHTSEAFNIDVLNGKYKKEIK